MEYSWRKISLIAIFTGLSVDILIYVYHAYLKHNAKKRLAAQLDTKESNVFFFPDQSMSGPLATNAIDNDKKLNASQNNSPTFELSKIIQSAKSTLDVCVFVITSSLLTDEVIKVSDRGVYVRIITDEEQAQDCYGSKIEKFRAAGKLKHTI